MICFGQGKLSDPLGMTQVDESVKKYGASRSLVASRGSWNLWPFFNRSKTISNSKATSEGKMETADDLAFRSTGNMTMESSLPKEKGSKKIQSLTPTTEELASLNLKEGKNLVKFNFSTPMLGLQQVYPSLFFFYCSCCAYNLLSVFSFIEKIPNSFIFTRLMQGFTFGNGILR